MLKVRDIRKRLLRLGLDITADQIRSMEKKGLFCSTRSEAGYRQYNAEQVNNIITAILLHKIGYTVEEINENKKHLLDLIGKAVKSMKG